jgi:hypothetical protein
VSRVTIVFAVAAAAIVAAACSPGRLTREQATVLLRPQVAATLTMLVPDGPWRTYTADFMMDADYVRALVNRGIVRTFKSTERTYSIRSGEGVREINVAAPTDFARPFLIEHRFTPDKVRPVLVLANAQLHEVTSVQQQAEAADVDFTWTWAPTPVGAKLDGLTVQRRNAPPITIALHATPRVARARCAVLERHWHCALDDWPRTRLVNQD